MPKTPRPKKGTREFRRCPGCKTKFVRPKDASLVEVCGICGYEGPLKLVVTTKTA